MTQETLTGERRKPRGGRPLGIGLLGCGTVGTGVLELVRDNAAYLGDRVGAPLAVRRVAVRDTKKTRTDALGDVPITDDPKSVVEDPEVELVVELMGGVDLAGECVERALAAGKGVVTANKALLADRGPDLVGLAQRARADLAFEAAVGGGIPIIRTLRDALASDWVEEVTAILNGTSNYVLTEMLGKGLPADVVIKKAQELGYAEADPTLDVGGFDAAHKLVVMAMLAFGAAVDKDAVHTEGITEIAAVDHRYADRFGYVIKHLAIGRDRDREIELRVHPALIPKTSVLANVSGVLNAVFLRGRGLGPCLLSGPGAGAMPTAVSVVSDIVDVARSIVMEVPGLSTRGIATQKRPLRSQADVETRYYLRFSALDRPGVMGGLAGALGQHGVNIQQIVQPDPGTDGGADIVMLTQRAKEGDLGEALRAIEALGITRGRPQLLRVEEE